jgi:hypothetical protein
LPVERLAQLDSGDLCHCIGLIGRLKFPTQQIFLLYRLRSILGIDTGAAQEKELLYAIHMSSLYNVDLYKEIVVKEVSRIGAVSKYASHSGSREEYILRALLIKERPDISLNLQV